MPSVGELGERRELFDADGNRICGSHPGKQPDNTQCASLGPGTPEKFFHKSKKGT